MQAQDLAAHVRSHAGLFDLPTRGVLAVRGRDRTRWLNGMISNDVARLAPGPESSGCYAMLLTPKGRIVADLHVLLRPEELWLELPRAEIPIVRERLAKLIIADDVTLVDRSHEIARLGLEGPKSLALVCDLLSPAEQGAAKALALDACMEARIAGRDLVLCAFGFSGERALQVFVPGPPGAEQSVRNALLSVGAPHGLVPATDEVLEILRVEAGIPRLHAELSEDVLPPEARLERAISYTKGCYTGQEIIARIRSRGQVAHLLVGIAVEGESTARSGDAVQVSGEGVGAVTSAALSPVAGRIALAFVRRPYAEPGTRVAVGTGSGRVVALPFVSPVSPAAS
ncbi:MAG TPA: glycine cleavage T C-terminal barrel domain-containing protein [Myxococcota bacterium]|nr:glycine cleavage T C-terminal barrel domain-containing protein [Myxococcota bacterium]